MTGKLIMKSISLQLTFMLHFSLSEYKKNETINGWLRCQRIDGLSKSNENYLGFIFLLQILIQFIVCPQLWGRTDEPNQKKRKSISVNINILLPLKLLNVISTTYKKI